MVAKAAEVAALAAGVALLAIMAATSLNAAGFALDRLARPFGGAVPGLPGYEDFVNLTLSGAALLFFPYCQLRRGHVVVDIFTKGLPAPLGRALDLLWLLVLAALALFLAYWMTLGLMETRADGVRSPVLGWPLWPFYLPGVAALLLWALVCLTQAAAGPEAGASGAAEGASGQDG